VVHTFHGHVFHGYFGAAKTRFFIELEKFCARLSSRIITISDRLKSEIVSYGITDASQIEVIPLGLELHRLKDVSTTNRFRAEFDLPADVGLVGAVGRLVPIKNLHLFLEAAAIAYHQNPNLRFAIVGDGELRGELETYAEQLHIETSVIFTGWRRDLAQVYADLDAVVISSDNEGTPASLIEAMAAGCPVISTRVGGVADLIQEGYTGRLVPPRDPEALAQAILTLFEESTTTAQLAQEAQRLMLQNYTSERLVADMDKFYKTLTRVSNACPSSLGVASGMNRR
jgi:glycosyltransferase involved in cell wall biosynthesis